MAPKKCCTFPARCSASVPPVLGMPGISCHTLASSGYASSSRLTARSSLVRSSCRVAISIDRLTPARDDEVEVGGLEGAHEPNPQWQHHLRPARSGDVADVDHALPAEPLLEKVRDSGLRRRIVTTDEECMIARYPRRLDHDVRAHSVERFNDLRFWELALNLFSK